MAINKILNTRLCLKYDTYANWEANKTFIPLVGEVCVCAVDDNNDNKIEDFLLKVGDGSTTWENLPWVSAKAADVHEWAKRSSVDVSFKSVQQDVIVDKETGATEPINVNVPYLCFNNGYTSQDGYADAIEFSLEGLFDPKDLTDDLKRLVGTGSIADAINIVYNAVQVGGTGSLVSFADNDSDNTFKKTVYQGNNKLYDISFTTKDGILYDNVKKELKLDLKDSTKLNKSASTVEDPNVGIYPVQLDSNGDLAVSVPLEFNSGMYTVDASMAGSKNDKIDFSVYQGLAGWGALAGESLEINIGSGLTYTKDDKTLSHATPVRGTVLTPEHVESNTVKAITSIAVDEFGHITGATSANIDTTDNDTTYDLRTKESTDKGIVELYDEINETSDDINFNGDTKITVTSDSNNNVNITHNAITIDRTNNDSVSLLHNGEFTVYTDVDADETGHLTKAKKTTFTLPEDSDTITHVAAKEGNPITVTDTPTSDGCDHHYIVEHNPVIKNDVTSESAQQLVHGEEIQVVSAVTYDEFGHTSGINTKKYKLPVHTIIKEDPDDVEEKSEFVSYISEEKDDNGKNTGNIVYHTEPFISDITSDVHDVLGNVVTTGTKDSVRAPQTKAIVSYVDKAIKSIETEISVATSGAVVIKGTVGSLKDCATASELPRADKTTVGHAYKVVTDNYLRLEDVLHKQDTMNHPEFARKGDMLIGYMHVDSDSDSYRWLYVPAADENFDIGYKDGNNPIEYVADTQEINAIVYSTPTGSGLNVKSTRKRDESDETKTVLDVSLGHAKFRDKSKDETADVNIGNDNSFTVVESIEDDNGHIISIDKKNITIKESPAFAEIIADNNAVSTAPKSTETNIVADTIDSTLTVSGSNKWVVAGVEDKTLYLGHSLSGVAAGTKGSTDGSKFKVPSITVDEAGHITGLTEGEELEIPTILHLQHIYQTRLL